MLKNILNDLTTEELKTHLDSKDGNCDNCDNRSRNLKIELCPICYKEIVVGPDYTVKDYILTIREILNERS